MQAPEIPKEVADAVVILLSPYFHQRLTIETIIAGIESLQGMLPEAERLLTKREVAEMLRCSLPTVNRMLQDQRLQKIMVRGSVRISESAVRKIIMGGADG